MRQGTWATMFGPRKTSTSILNEVSAKRNADFNNTIDKQEWCERIKALGTEAFGWDFLFEAGEPDWTQGWGKGEEGRFGPIFGAPDIDWKRSK
jgi:hypothetical protein